MIIKIRSIAKVTSIALLFVLASSQTLQAEDFLIRDIKVAGTERLDDGTVLTYLNLNPGETVSQAKLARALRGLFKTELFQDIQFDKEGDTLVVRVKERPVIRKVELEGNKAIKDEDIESSLLQAGITKGRPLKRNIVEEIESALQSGYYDQGKYGAEITANVSDRGNNTVDIEIDVKEGDFSKVAGINFVGNEIFSDATLRSELKTKTTNWLSFIRGDDKYSKQQLQGDLESIRSFYINNGYADFGVNSLQVTISPDKKDLFLTVNLSEGEIYQFGKGTLINEGEELDSALVERLINALEGETFSYARLEQISEFGKTILGNKGFANAEIEPLPSLDKENKIANFSILVNPGKKVFVRNIYFVGLENTEDEVLRRELRFFEGGPMINLERSKYRLQRLPYVKSAEIEPVAVSGSSDRMDVKVSIEPGQPGDFNASAGYSSSTGVILSGGFTNTNFFGTGNTVASSLSLSDFTKGASFNFTDPYYRDSGVSRSFGFSYFDSSRPITDASSLDTTQGSLNLSYGYPLSEYSSIRFGGRLVQNEFVTSGASSIQQQEFVRNNGETYTQTFTDFLGQQGELFGTEYLNLELLMNYSYDSRNNYLFANRGARAFIGFETAIPGSEVEYYSINLDYQKYFPITSGFYLRNKTNISFAEDFGDTTMLPPSSNFYSSSGSNVRGFRQNWLGPRDSRGRPFGGNLRVMNNLDLYGPVPEKFQGSMRYSLFVDTGNVYYQGNDQLFPREDFGFDAERLRASAGISIEWLSPLGLIGLSYGVPIHEFRDDDIERLQFNVSQGF